MNMLNGTAAKNKASRALLCLLLASSAACAESPSKESGLSSQLEIGPRNVYTVQNPIMLVTFDTVGTGNALCPTEVDFRIEVAGKEFILPTGVPVQPSGNTIRWIAVDPTFAILPHTEGFYFGVTFHPFKNMNNNALVSKEKGSGDMKRYEAGPVDFRNAGLLPVGVNYKYTVVRLKRENSVFIIDEDCAPLDPFIRLI